MAPKLTVILDDRDAVADSVMAALGRVRFSDILRRRTLLVDDLKSGCVEADEIVHLTQASEARDLSRIIEERREQFLYLRIPLCLAPLKPDGVRTLVGKARFALDTLICTEIMGDEAVVVVGHKEAKSLISADDPEARRAMLQALYDTGTLIIDHASFVDIRKPRNLMNFLSGATEARYFNTTSAEGNTFKKSSTDMAKMKVEYNFFDMAPPAMRRFLMPPFDYWEKNGHAGYSMENLSVPDAALQFVHGAFDREDFDALLNSFFEFLASRPQDPDDVKSIYEAGHAYIIGKLNTRMETFLASPVGARVNAILAACGSQWDLASMTARAVPLIETHLKACKARALALSHGDPCFSNILFDRRLGLMRLIDPKGGASRADCMVHPYYDIAKFSHSVLGGYDSINNGLCQVHLDSTLSPRLIWARGKPPQWAGEVFRARAQAAGYDMKTVRAVELSLFLSMLPLHADHPEKLMGFALVAADILTELEGKA